MALPKYSWTDKGEDRKELKPWLAEREGLSYLMKLFTLFIFCETYAKKKKKERQEKMSKGTAKKTYSEKVRRTANFNWHNLTGIQLQNPMLASCLYYLTRIIKLSDRN